MTDQPTNTPENWYTLPAGDRFLVAQARCVELLGEEKFGDLVTDYARGNLGNTLLESMENWLKENDPQRKS